MAGHFLGSALTFAVDGTPVDVVSGIKRHPDNPPPNRSAADVELVMPGGSPEGFGVAPIAPLAVSDHGAGVVGTLAHRVLLDVRGDATHRWQPPLIADASGRLELRATDDGPRWRPGCGDR